MTYALDKALFVENGPAVQAAIAAARRPLGRLSGWNGLDPSSRLKAVERALRTPANDRFDALPLAL